MTRISVGDGKRSSSPGERFSNLGKRFWSSLERPFPNSVAQKSLVALVLVAALAIAVATPLTSEDGLARGGGVAAISIVSFIVFFQSDSGTEDRSQGLRRAIAASTILTFLVVLGFVTFSPDVQDDAGGTEVATELMGDFRWVVMTVVGFYFTSEMVSRYLTLRFGSSDGDRSEPNT